MQAISNDSICHMQQKKDTGTTLPTSKVTELLSELLGFSSKDLLYLYKEMRTKLPTTKQVIMACHFK